MRARKGMQRVKPHKVRAYKGMTQGSISQRKLTVSTFVTHVLDRDPESATYGKLIERASS